MAPRPPERNPFELFIAVVMTASMLKPAFGRSELPNSLSSITANFGQVVAVLLFVGCGAIVAGLLYPKRDTGLPIEQFGCVLAFFGFLGYTYAVFDFNSFTQTRVAASSTLGIAIGAAVRWVQIQLYVRKRKLQYGQTEIHRG